MAFVYFIKRCVASRDKPVACSTLIYGKMCAHLCCAVILHPMVCRATFLLNLIVNKYMYMTLTATTLVGEISRHNERLNYYFFR